MSSLFAPTNVKAKDIFPYTGEKIKQTLNVYQNAINDKLRTDTATEIVDLIFLLVFHLYHCGYLLVTIADH